MNRCVACGKPIVLVHANPRVISLAMKWVHVSRWANRSHAAIPREAIATGWEIRAPR